MAGGPCRRRWPSGTRCAKAVTPRRPSRGARWRCPRPPYRLSETTGSGRPKTGRTPGHTARSPDQGGSHVTQNQCAPSRLTSLGIVQLAVLDLRLARTLKLPPWRRPGNPLVLVKQGQGCLEPVRSAKRLKPRRDLGVIPVRTIAAAGADQLIHVGISAFDAAVHEADRLAPQDRLAAVAGLTGGPGCHGVLRHDAQPPVTAIGGTSCGDSGRADSRSAARRRVRGARTAHSTHRQDVGSCHYRGLEQRRCYHQTVHAGRAKRHVQPGT